VLAWVISFVSSGTLTCAIVTESRWVTAEKRVTYAGTVMPFTPAALGALGALGDLAEPT
jgi:hypothetical protein